MILVLVTVGVLFVAGVRVKHLVVLVLAGLLAMPVMWLRMREYQKARLTVFLDPSRDPLNAGWNPLLLKVTQLNQGWAFCARFRKPDGSHLDGLQFAAEPP